jgi:hypothetical protein
MVKTLSSEMKRFACSYYAAIGTPFSKRLKDYVEEGKWDDLAHASCDPRDYSDADSYRLDCFAAGLLRKSGDLPTSIDRKAAALSNWWSGEKACFKTNLRLEPYLEGLSHPSCDARVLTHIGAMRKEVRRILGRPPLLMELEGRHGPGATYSDPSVRATAADKMNSVPSLTPGLLDILPYWWETLWGRACSAPGVNRRNPVEVRGNRFTTAPKDAKKDRPIAVEPSINVFYQLAVGKWIRKRLKQAASIDLNSGQQTHRQVARDASITGLFATLDLSNASDTVAYNLVKLLLPDDWFLLLSCLRSPYTEMRVSGQNRWIKLEKFSSMGNGFTFELETLLFFVITQYCVKQHEPDMVKDVLVYGDDIICPSGSVMPVIHCLQFFGFSLNQEKSFWSGPFRESCGGDFFNGEPVRPYQLKEFPHEPQEWIACANALRGAVEASFGTIDRFRSAWFVLLDQLPSEIRQCRGPKGLGDTVIHDDASRWDVHVRSQTSYVKAYKPVGALNGVPYKLFDPDVVLACAVLGFLWGRGQILPRTPKMSYKIGFSCIYGTSWVPGAKPPE